MSQHVTCEDEVSEPFYLLNPQTKINLHNNSEHSPINTVTFSNSQGPLLLVILSFFVRFSIHSNQILRYIIEYN